MVTAICQGLFLLRIYKLDASQGKLRRYVVPPVAFFILVAFTFGITAATFSLQIKKFAGTTGMNRVIISIFIYLIRPL